MPNFHTGLEKNPANYTPLTPIDFIERTASIYPDQTAIVYKDYQYNDLRQSWGETYNRCRKMSDALKKLGIDKDDTVAVIDLMLNDLRLETRKRLLARCERRVEIGDLYTLETRAGTCAL